MNILDPHEPLDMDWRPTPEEETPFLGEGMDNFLGCLGWCTIGWTILYFGWHVLAVCVRSLNT